MRLNKRIFVPDTSGIDSISDPLLLATALLKIERARRETYYSKYLRCSEIARVCVRENAIGWHYGMKKVEFINESSQLTFDIGTAVHRFMQNSGSYFGKDFLGWRECLACGSTVFGSFSQGRCQKCNAPGKASRYIEKEFKIPSPLPLSGHIDGFLKVCGGDVRIVDLKTINGPDFDALCSPIGDHVAQVVSYMIGCEESNDLPVAVNLESAFLIYISKKHEAKSIPVKAFHVRRMKSVEDSIRKDLEAFNAALSTGKLPAPIDACRRSGFKSYRARSCAVSSYCQKLLAGCNRLQKGEDKE